METMYSVREELDRHQEDETAMQNKTKQQPRLHLMSAALVKDNCTIFNS